MGRILPDSDAAAPAPTMSPHGTLVRVDFFVLMVLPARAGYISMGASPGRAIPLPTSCIPCMDPKTTRRQPRAAPQPHPMQQGAPEPLVTSPAQRSLSQLLSLTLLHGEMGVLPSLRVLPEEEICSLCASCTNQPNYPFRRQLTSLKLSEPAPPSLPAGEAASAGTVLG